MGKKFEPIACPICQNQKMTHLFTMEEEKFQKCVHCSFIMINPQPIVEVIDETYDENYAQRYIRKAKSKYKRAKRRLKYLKKRNKSAKRFVDIGSSAGFVVQAANDLKLDAYGVEIEKTGPKYAKEVLGLKNIYNMKLHDCKFEDNFFDIVTFYEVLEHIPNLDNFLQEVHRISTDNAILQLSVPNAGHWSIQKDMQLWDAIKPSEHLWYFDRTTIQRVLENNNFKVLKIETKLFNTNMKVTFTK